MRRPDTTIAAIVATIAIVLATCKLSASAEESQTEKDAKDGYALLDAMRHQVDKLQGYSFHSTLETYQTDQKEKPVKAEAQFYFKREHQIRVEIISAGTKNGSIVVEEADGKVRAQGGPRMLGLKMTISPNSRILVSANGFNILRSDLSSLYAHAATLLSSGLHAKASATPVIANGSETELLEIAGPNSDVIERVFVSRQTKTPVQWDLYRDNHLFSTLKISNFKADAPPSDDLFKL